MTSLLAGLSLKSNCVASSPGLHHHPVFDCSQYLCKKVEMGMAWDRSYTEFCLVSHSLLHKESIFCCFNSSNKHNSYYVKVYMLLEHKRIA